MDTYQHGPKWPWVFHRDQHWDPGIRQWHCRQPSQAFADDCAIYLQVSVSTDCTTLQGDLSIARLYSWSQKWQVPLNLSKCKAICISNKKKPPIYDYSLNSVALNWVHTFKYPGVRIDSKLKWGDQVTEVATRANRTLNLLRRTMYGCSKDAKKRAHTTLIRLQSEFCAPIWNPYTLKDCEKLEKVQ